MIHGCHWYETVYSICVIYIYICMMMSSLNILDTFRYICRWLYSTHDGKSRSARFTPRCRPRPLLSLSAAGAMGEVVKTSNSKHHLHRDAATWGSNRIYQVSVQKGTWCKPWYTILLLVLSYTVAIPVASPITSGMGILRVDTWHHYIKSRPKHAGMFDTINQSRKTTAKVRV